MVKKLVSTAKTWSLFMLVGILGLSSCAKEDAPPKKPELLIYCGITMVHPMHEIAMIFEQENNCKVTLLQGGSEDLYQSLKSSKQGDLYLPGSDSYRTKHFGDGLLSSYVFVGYNQLALLVKKDNPKNIPADLGVLSDKDIAVSIGNAESSSVGKHGKRVLDKFGIYDEVLYNTVEISSDSRTMNNLLRSGAVDVILNWRATAFFDENRDEIQALDLDASVAPKNRLLINLCNTSMNKDLAVAFMKLAASERGQQIFYKYGFLTSVGPAGDLED